MDMTNLPMGRIGGHRGLDVIRKYHVARILNDPETPEDRATVIEKQALHDIANQGQPPPDGLFGVDLYDLNVTAIHNEAAMLDIMSGSGYAPELIDVDGGVLTEEDLGHTGAPQDMEVWRQNLVRMLAAIRAHGLRHGDLKGNNIITRGNRSWAVDWQESHVIGDVAPQKSPYSDSLLLMQHIIGTLGTNGVADTPRVARRWGAVIGALSATTDLSLPLKGKTFLDLGCFQGDFCALAAAEGMSAVGIDQGGFRSGEDSIANGRRLWADFPFGEIDLVKRNIIGPGLYNADVVMMFSTWSYMVKDFGQARAEEELAKVIEQAGVFFFENQLAGDGPGPAFLQSDEDIWAMMFRLGASKVRDIGTFPVTGRPAGRTVWRVEG